jgi:hypothetical protein
VDKYLASHTLPVQLLRFLEDPNIHKAGVGVKTDLANLKKECAFPREFAGALELASFVKEHLPVRHHHPSLSDLCA